jgi:hypothetical protein
MKRSLNQFLATVMLASALAFSSCTKDSATAPEPATVEAAGIGSSAQSSESSESGEYTFRDVEVELNDVGRENLISLGYSRMRPKADDIYVTDVNNPWEPYDPILCDGMTYSQLWNDIWQRQANFLNSPQGQALKAQANATCRPVRYGISNCGVCVLFLLMPDRLCYDVAEEIAHTTRMKAQLVIEP